MSKRTRSPKVADAVNLDLQAFSQTLTEPLPLLLFSRDRDALVRWSTVRRWVDDALAGEAAPDLTTVEMAIAYLLERGADTPRP